MKMLMVAMVLLLSITGFSQTKEKADRKKDKERTEKSKGEGRGDRFMEDFNDLNLSDKQQNDLKVLFENERKNQSQSRGNFGRDDESGRPSESEMKEMREEMKQRREALDGKVKNILNAEQYAKWKEKQTARMSEHFSRR